jgi:hypothetical protein
MAMRLAGAVRAARALEADAVTDGTGSRDCIGDGAGNASDARRVASGFVRLSGLPMIFR